MLENHPIYLLMRRNYNLCPSEASKMSCFAIEYSRLGTCNLPYTPVRNANTTNNCRNRTHIIA